MKFRVFSLLFVLLFSNISYADDFTLGSHKFNKKKFTVDIVENLQGIFPFYAQGVTPNPPTNPFPAGTQLIVQGKVYPENATSACSMGSPCDDTVLPPSIGSWVLDIAILQDTLPTTPDGITFQGSGVVYFHEENDQANNSLIAISGGGNTPFSTTPYHMGVTGGTKFFKRARGQVTVQHGLFDPVNGFATKRLTFQIR